MVDQSLLILEKTDLVSHNSLNIFIQKAGFSEVHAAYALLNELPQSDLKNPLKIDGSWVLKKTTILGSDELQVFERKELCLQE